jgi:hypothetical protein
LICFDFEDRKICKEGSLLPFAPGVKENLVTPIRTAQETLLFIKTNRSILYRKIVSACSKVHKGH